MPEIISSNPNIPNLVVHPDERLYQPCEEIKKITDEVRKDAQKMIDATKYYEGIGIGGPQIGIMKKIAICCIGYFEKIDKESWISDDSIDKDYCVLLNPKIIEESEELMTNDEGCLSLPGVRVDVTRPKKIKVKFMDLEGKNREVEVKGYLAANFQHEIDHINGVTLISKLSGLKKSIQIKKIAKNLKRMKIKY